ncbi:degenerin mec-10-like, partial [Paramuricea clavata]
IHIKRLDRFNNGSCRTNGQLDERNPFWLKFGAEYSIQACLQYCYALSQINQCGCAEYSYFGAAPLGKICDENDQTVDECLDNWKSSDGPCEKTCPDLCSETLYESSLTFTQWPYPKSVESVLGSLGFNYSDYNNNVNLVRGNFLTANIFYQRFRESQIEESLSYETANLLADIGGQIGLWAGLSIISMCELLELFALVFRDFFERERR